MNSNPNVTHFKLTSASGPSQTRRVTFQSRPTWLALSDKIHVLFGISPLENMAVSYIDVEGDEVTLSTQEELEGYYQDVDTLGLWKPGQPIKLTVLDLSSARLGRSEEQRKEGLVDTDNREDLDEEWLQCTPPLPDSDGAKDPFADDHEPPQAPVVSSDSAFTSSLGQSKNRAVEVEEVPDVRDTSSVSVDAPVVTFLTDIEVPKGEEMDIDQTTLSSRDVTTEPIPRDAGENNDSNDDPPLPSLDATSLEAEYHNANPSLSSDIATLISSLSNIIASHPELSEGVRNVVQAAVRGYYWPVQREALQRAARDVSESLSRVDQEAGDVGRKVSEALGSFFQTVVQLATASGLSGANVNSTCNADAQENADASTSTAAKESENANSRDTSGDGSTARGHRRFSQQGNRGPWHHPHFGAHNFGGFGTFGPWMSSPPHPPPHPPHHPPPFGGFPGMFGMHYPPPPPPPPPPSGPTPPSPTPPGPPGGFPPPPPPPPPGSPGSVPPPPPPRRHIFPQFGDDLLSSFTRVESYPGDAHFVSTGGSHFVNGSRVGVPWDSSNNVHVDSSNGPANHSFIISGRGRSDRFPHRSNTMPSRRPPPPSKTEGSKDTTMEGVRIQEVENTDASAPEVPAAGPSHFDALNRRSTMEDIRGSRRRERERERGTKRLFKILKNLSDMGFSARDHSEVLSRVQELLSSNPSIKDEEIMTTVLNEVLNKPAANEVNLPGSWE